MKQRYVQRGKVCQNGRLLNENPKRRVLTIASSAAMMKVVDRIAREMMVMWGNAAASVFSRFTRMRLCMASDDSPWRHDLDPARAVASAQGSFVMGVLPRAWKCFGIDGLDALTGAGLR